MEVPVYPLCKRGLIVEASLVGMGSGHLHQKLIKFEHGWRKGEKADRAVICGIFFSVEVGNISSSVVTVS